MTKEQPLFIYIEGLSYGMENSLFALFFQIIETFRERSQSWEFFFLDFNIAEEPGFDGFLENLEFLYPIRKV